MLIVKSVIGIGFQLAFFAALMFGPIGTIDWPVAIIWLQLYAATAFALVFVTGSMVYRIHVEEAALSTGLPGYEAYKQRVTKRLLPFIY